MVAPKRVKKEAPIGIYSLVIPEIGPFRTLFEIVEPSFATLILGVVRSPTFEGLSFMAFSGQSCMVKARIALNVSYLNLPSGTNLIRQSLNISSFLKMMKAFHAQNSLKIECFNEEEITYSCFPRDETQMTHYTKGIIKLLSESDDMNAPDLSGLKFERIITIALNDFRNILNSAVAFKAADVTLTIRETKEQIGEKKMKITSLFIVGYTSDLGSSQTIYPSSCMIDRSEQEGGTVVIKACDPQAFDEEEIGDETIYESFYSASFSSSMLHNIVKNMPTANLTLNITNNRPLIIQYAFGENSSLAFAAAPRVPENPEDK